MELLVLRHGLGLGGSHTVMSIDPYRNLIDISWTPSLYTPVHLAVILLQSIM